MPTDAPILVWRSAPPIHRKPARSFLPLLRAAVTARPDRYDLLRDLAVALRDDERWTEICDLLSPLAESSGLTATLACELARAAIACGQPDLALKGLDSTGAEATRELRQQRALALYALNRIADARTAAALALMDDPGNRSLLDAVANDCFSRGAAEELVAVCQRAILCGVASSTHFAYLSAALSLAGREAELRELLDPERLCHRVELNADVIDNEELSGAILAHPLLARSPLARPTRGHNLRLEGLAGIEHPAIRNLFAVIRTQIDLYLAERLNVPHPLIAHRPHAARLQGWALVLSEDGHEEMHIHPQAWLTVVYYARMPKAADPTAARNERSPGSLAFGPWPPSVEHLLPDFPRWQVEPREGTLLIFPAFLGHGTIPTAMGEPRICVALDVLPCDTPRA